MTSGNFATVDPRSITTNRDERQRRKLVQIEELADSISRSGLIHPPVITRDNVLVAGERRLTAVLSLGWTAMPVQYAEDLDPIELKLIELEENTRRVDIDWKDNCLAVNEYHELRKGLDSSWNQSRTAQALGILPKDVMHRINVAEEITRGTKQVLEAPKYSVARGLVERKRARAKTEILQNVTISDEPRPAKPLPPILNADFTEWVAAYTGPKFNFLHCDFPYGVTVGGHGQAADKAFGNYTDNTETYWNLLDTLAAHIDTLLHPQAHMMFWFSMKFYEKTRIRLMEMGWQVYVHPLVWVKSDNTGIVSDVNQVPRNITETAFHCIRGKRPIVRPIANAYYGPATKTIHTSEKPVALLEHFFRMYVDDSTYMLDPTCGSANALKAALRHGAARVQGIERDANFYGAAVAAWED